MDNTIIALDRAFFDELEHAAWAIPDTTPEGKRLRAAVTLASMNRRLLPNGKLPEPKQNDTQLG